ncbi:MAG TPA: hypothetical protein VLE93_02300 [Candidatus Saccharimonadales bacterium]|nr:hypothetical protein [Candidatus Saccharimonadales bacterium]
MPNFLPGRSYVVVGQLDEAALTDVLPVDRLTVNAGGLEVKTLRQLIATFYQRPHGAQRLALIKNAEALSVIHQNTLLKVLEEPPPALTIILEVRSAEGLLPTVRSRLQVVIGQAAAAQLQPVLTGEVSADLKILQSAKDRTGLIELFRRELHYQLDQFGELADGNCLSALEAAVTRLEHNCNQKLVIDRFLLQRPANQSKNKKNA